MSDTPDNADAGAMMQVNFRMPAGLKETLQRAADSAGRSLTQEVNIRLLDSFSFIHIPMDLRHRVSDSADRHGWTVDQEIARRLELSFQLDRELPIASMALDEVEAGIAQQREMFDLTKELVEEVKGLRTIVTHIAENGLAPEVQADLKKLVNSRDKG